MDPLEASKYVIGQLDLNKTDPKQWKLDTTDSEPFSTILKQTFPFLHNDEFSTCISKIHLLGLRGFLNKRRLGTANDILEQILLQALHDHTSLHFLPISYSLHWKANEIFMTCIAPGCNCILRIDQYVICVLSHIYFMASIGL